MNALTFSIPGRVGGWQRGRRDTRISAAHTFTPKKMVSDQGVVKHYASQAMKNRALFTGPLLFGMIINRHKPASWAKKKRDETHWITGKPDFDNQSGLFSDCLNHIVWHDDSQIALHAIARKYLLDPFVTESTRVIVMSLETRENELANILQVLAR